jgi:DNA (cytosine-5)-methyltransferase 1
MHSNDIPKAIDVFSGCGGLTSGLRAAGFQVVAGVEIRLDARMAYELNHPGVILFEDVRTLSANVMLSAIGIEKGDLDLLAGCPPCQGFSRMRTKNRAHPADDARNDLIFDFIRLVKELLPKTIMLENVPGLKEDWRFREATKRLEKAGYQWVCEVVNAADYGVPQRRKRMILMASRLGSITIPQGNSNHKTVRDTIGDLPAPRKSHKPLHKLLAEHGDEVMNRIRQTPRNGGSRSAWGEENQLDCHKRLDDGFRDVYGRMAWDDVAPTITRSCVNPSKGRFLHPAQNREISLYEAALLQSFPRSYKFPISQGREAIASMIGEALPPLLAEKQARHVLKHIQAAK